MLSHTRYGQSHEIWAVTRDMVSHTRYAQSHEICSVTRDMVSHTRYGQSHEIWAVTRDMLSHTRYGQSHEIWSVTRDMVSHTRYGQSHEIGCPVVLFFTNSNTSAASATPAVSPPQSRVLATRTNIESERPKTYSTSLLKLCHISFETYHIFLSQRLLLNIQHLNNKSIATG